MFVKIYINIYKLTSYVCKNGLTSSALVVVKKVETNSINIWCGSSSTGSWCMPSTSDSKR